MAERLDPESAVAYLRREKRVPPSADVRADPLGGGVSNDIFRVTWDGGCLVVKRPLPNLAVDDDWPADVARVHNEAAAARGYDRLLDATGVEGVRVPRVEFEDREAHVIGTSCAPADAANWKAELLGGDADADVAARLGGALAALQTAAASDGDLREAFADGRPFEQLRLDPYHRTVAARHPDVADAVRRELDRVRDADRTLVHGDYSPKNVLVDRGADPPVLWLIDFEAAHWGDPAFDAAFMLNHLFIKAVYNAADREAYLGAASAFWNAYAATADWDVEAATVAELGVLMLARVDGKSPVEYVTAAPTKDALRRVAKRALADDLRTLSAFEGEVRTAAGEVAA